MAQSITNYLFVFAPKLNKLDHKITAVSRSWCALLKARLHHSDNGKKINTGRILLLRERSQSQFIREMFRVKNDISKFLCCLVIS